MTIDTTYFIDNNKKNILSEIALIYVLYNPSCEQISNICHISSLYYGYIVDNSDCPTFSYNQNCRMSYIFNKGNYGIAYAQNIALRHIFTKTHFKYVVFLDQDSKIDDEYPFNMVSAYIKLKAIHPNLAFLGPTVINTANDIVYKSIFHKDHHLSSNLILKREIISSGSCIETDTLRNIGLGEEDFFLDFVDCEWCWRAKSMGYINGITPLLTIYHKIGSNDIYIGKYEIIVSAPFRYFYQCRNYLWLLRRRYVPTQWKIANGIKLFCRFLYFPFTVKKGLRCSQYMLKGFRAGLYGSPNI